MIYLEIGSSALGCILPWGPLASLLVLRAWVHRGFAESEGLCQRAVHMWTFGARGYEEGGSETLLLMRTHPRGN